MKIVKKAVALLLALALMLTFAACHPKDEAAVWVGDHKITSAMYSYYLLMADSEAMTAVGESGVDTTAENFSYYSQTIDGKDYETYVRELAIDKCLYHIALEKLCADSGLSLDEDTKAYYQSYAAYYWESYGYASLLEPNGVSYDTYEKIVLNDALYNVYFDHLYGEEGTSAVSDEEISKALDENYAAVYVITHDYSTVTDPDTEAIKEELSKYVTAFENGDDYETVLAAYEADQSGDTEDADDETADEAEDTADTEDTDSETADTSDENTEETDAPEDENIVIYTGYEKTSSEQTGSGYATYVSYFDDIAALETGAATVIDDSENKKMLVVLKADILADQYYFDVLRSEVVYMLKGDSFDSYLTEYSSGLQYEVSNYAIKQFKLKDIYYGEE